MSTKAISLKLPIELLERLRARATTEGTSVSAILIEGVAGNDGATVRVAELQATVKEMETAIERLTVDRDQWRDRAKAIVSAGKEPANAASTKATGHRATGPALEPRLNVQGAAKPMFKAGSEAEKRLKG